MQALFVRTVAGDTIVNLENVTQIEVFIANDMPTLEVSFVGNPATANFPMRRGVGRDEVMERVRRAFVPLYEGRMGTVLGTEMWLNISDLQQRPGEERF